MPGSRDTTGPSAYVAVPVQGLDYRNLAVFIGSFDYIIPFNPFLLGASCKQNAFHDAPDRQGLIATGNIIPFDRNM